MTPFLSCGEGGSQASWIRVGVRARAIRARGGPSGTAGGHFSHVISNVTRYVIRHVTSMINHVNGHVIKNAQSHDQSCG